MKKYLLVLLGLFVLTTTTYSQELTEKEKARQEKEARKQAKENAKKEAKLKKAAKKDAKITRVRQKDKLYKNRDTLSKICFTA